MSSLVWKMKVGGVRLLTLCSEDSERIFAGSLRGSSRPLRFLREPAWVTPSSMLITG